MKLDLARTWRPLDDSDLGKVDQVIPIAIILSIKRDGTYKARAVVLGNMDKSGHNVEVFAPVISQAGNRYLLTEAAACGDFIIGCDLDCAFLNAE